MKKVPLLALFLTLFAASSAFAQRVPWRAVPLNDPSITEYGARMRVTKSAWDFALLTIRDNFRVWSHPGGAGANLLLDPGYDCVNHGSAGFIRTTPFVYDYVRWDGAINRSDANLNCGDYIVPCTGCNADRTCGRYCSKGAVQGPSGSNTEWTQVRRPGANLGTNTPPVPTVARPFFREHGFYVADPSTPGQDFKQLQFCTNRYSYDSGSGKTGLCPEERKNFEVCSPPFDWPCTTIYFHYNVRVFIFPNMRTEYMGASGNCTYDPVSCKYPHDPAQADPWNPPANRGSYTGVSSTNSVGTIAGSGISDCRTGTVGWCNTGGGCCCTWCACLASKKTSGCYTTYTPTQYRYVFQSAVLPHTPSAGRNLRDGTYVRGGDDQAVYSNIGQMQIHSLNRNSFLGTESTGNGGQGWRECDKEWYYDGTLKDQDPGPGVNLQPNLIQHSQKAANCMYPKSYWDFDTNRWKACDPYDTWNADGTLNPANDDAKFMYPGHPVTGGFGSPGRCGRQPACVSAGGGNCSVYTVTQTYCTGAESGSGCTLGQKARTMRFKDLFEPGGGWYFIKVQDLAMCPANQTCAGAIPPTSPRPRMVLDLRIPDLRVEAGLALDARVEGAVVTDQDMRNIRASGQLKMNSIAVKASVFISSLDDKSCSSSGGATCEAPFDAVNDGIFAPDQLDFEISIDEFKINSPHPWFVGDCDQFFFDIIWGAGFTISACDFINDDIKISLLGFPISFSLGVKPMLEEIIEDALSEEIKAALSDFIAAVPNLNGVLGDPMNVAGRALINTGIYAAGSQAEATTVNGTTRYPVHMWPGPTAEQVITDFRFALGFKPIAFKPPVGPNQVMEIDNADPPAATSIYGVPTLMNPNLAGCPNCAVRSAPGAPASGAYVDEDQQYDTDDQVLAASGWYYPNPTGVGQTFLARSRAVPEFWQGPITAGNRPPTWCARVPDENTWEAPRTIRSGGGTAADFKALYPQTTWLSFDRNLDKPPAGSGMSLPAARNTYGAWDSMDPNTIFMQNRNDGVKDPGRVPYDFSMHVHQRTIAQFLQTVVASGATCIEFAPTDEQGKETAFAPLLTTNIFAALLPDLTREFPNEHMKVRMHVTGTPRARTGMGRLEYVPSVFNGTPAGESPLPIAPTAYMLSAAFPDTRIEFLVANEAGDDIPILTLYWTPVVGLHMQSVRRCYYLDPLFDDPQAGGDLTKSRCFSPYTNVRTVSGYYEIYLDMGSDSLKDAWSAGGTLANTRDFPAGYFEDIGMSRFFNGQPVGNKSHIAIASSYCDFAATCDRLAVAQLVPTLMDSFVSLFVVSRFSMLNLSLDFLYTGVDGPNDDGIGQGDYLGIYARFLGSLDLFSLLENLDGMFAPKNGVEPAAYVPDLPQNTQWFRTNRPAFPVTMVKQFAETGTPSDIAYTYSLNGGFWRTPVNRAELEVGPLWEGEHKLALRAVEHTQFGATAALTPFEVKFRVDTVAPEVNIRPSPRGTYNKAVGIQVTDLQTPGESLVKEYRWNDAQWKPLDGSALSVRDLAPGKYTLRVRATDLAGNTGESAREITVGEPGFWGCGQASAAPDAGAALLMLILVMARYRRVRLRERMQ